MARRSSGGGVAVEVVGLPELRRQLRQMENPRRWTQELGASQREIAKKVAAWSQSAARGVGGSTGHFAGAIAGRGGVSGARIQIRKNEANAAFWGAKQRTGWNTGNESPNHPKWVGNQWEVGSSGGPYAINPTIQNRLTDIMEMYGEAVDRIWGEATTYTSTTF